MHTTARRLPRLATLSLLTFATAAAAQVTAPVAPPPTPSTTAPADPAAATSPEATTTPQPSGIAGAVSPVSPSTRVSFNFKDAPIDSILDYLSENLGFIIIKDGHIEGRVTITSKQPVGPDEAVDLLDSVLKPVKYTVMQTGRVLRVVSLDKAQKSSIPVHFGADPQQIRDSDELITQVIPLGQVDAVKLKTDLTSMFSADAEVTANAASNTIVITDTATNIRHLVQIISVMDQHLSTSTDIKVFKLKHADAADAAKLINDVFKAPTSSQSSTPTGNQRGGGFGGGGFGGGGFGGGGFGRGGGGAAATPAADTTGARSTTVTASSDERTNTVVVVGATEVLTEVQNIINQLDADPAQDTVFFIYHLKNANSANLQTVLNSFFGNSSSGTVTSNNRSVTGFTTLGTSSSGSGSSGFGATSGNRNTSSNSNTITAASSNGITRQGGANGTNSTTTPNAVSDLQGQAFVVADNDTNSLLVTATSKYADRVHQMIVDLDRDIPQVLIKALIVEVTHTDTADIGVEYSILNTRPSGNGQSGGSDFGLAQAVSSAVESGTPNGLVAKVVESNLSATLKALATAGKLEVLSRPSILGVDNQLASIMVGQSVPFITASNITDQGTIINTVEYQPIGIILNVTPHINPDGMVTLDVAPQVSQISDQTVTIQAGVTAPVFDQRAAQCRVAIRNNQTIVIGGLMQDTKNETVDKIPLLGDIPYLGNLFSVHNNTKIKTELLIFLTPEVAQSTEGLPAMSKEETGATKIMPDAIAPGVLQDYLQHMHRPASTQPSDVPPVTNPQTEYHPLPQSSETPTNGPGQ